MDMTLPPAVEIFCDLHHTRSGLPTEAGTVPPARKETASDAVAWRTELAPGPGQEGKPCQREGGLARLAAGVDRASSASLARFSSAAIPLSTVHTASLNASAAGESAALRRWTKP